MDKILDNNCPKSGGGMMMNHKLVLYCLNGKNKKGETLWRKQ
jgi:hypothetical protein